MENLFLEKNIVQKLIIAIVIVILFNFVSPTACQAKGYLAEAGGELLMPIMELFMSIFDGVLSVLQTNLLSEIDILLPATSKETGDKKGGLGKLLIAAVCVVAAVTFAVATFGTGTAAAAAAGGSLVAALFSAGGVSLAGSLVIGVAATVGCTVGAVYFTKEGVKDFVGYFDIPTIVYTPFAIFSGMIPMFDINFFSPKSTSESKVYNVPELIGEEVAEANKVTEASNVIDSGQYHVHFDDSGNLIFEGLEDHIMEKVGYQVYAYGDLKVTDEEEECARLSYSAKEVAEMAAKVMFFNAGAWRDDIQGYNKKYEKVNSIIKKWLENGVVLAGANITTTGMQNVLGIGLSNIGIDDDRDLANVMWSCYEQTSFEKMAAKDVWEEIANSTEVSNNSGVFYDCYFTEIRDGVYYVNGQPYTNTKYDNGEYVYDSSSGTPIKEIIKKYGTDTLKDEIKTAYDEVMRLDSAVEENYDPNSSIESRRNPVEDYTLTSPAQVLQETVSSWYYNLRNLALVALLVILVYIGIRIVLSSTAPEKAKYKQMIVNWVVAICILFLLHIIMITILTISEKITEGLSNNCSEYIILDLPNNTKVAEKGGDYEALGDDNAHIVTNFVGAVRYYAGIFSDDGALKGIGYIIMYIMLVVQTCMFTWVYGKRVVYMAFLTIIAPLVAITYPIDKIGDGKSQAFDMWIKEYIFNALLQPIHLLIYTLLCGTALDLMMKQPIYGIIALAFVVPAEKFIRKMFGFEKAQTPSALGGAAGAALAMTGIQKLGGLIRPDGRDDREADKPPKSHRIRQVDTSTQSDERSATDAARERYLGSSSRDIRTNGGASNQRGNNSQARNGGNPPIGGDNNPPDDNGNPPVTPLGGVDDATDDVNPPVTPLGGDNDQLDDDGNPPVTPLGGVDDATDDGNPPITPLGGVDDATDDGNPPVTPLGGVDDATDDGNPPVTPLGGVDGPTDDGNPPTGVGTPTPDGGDNSTQTNGVNMDEMARRQAARDQARMEERSQRQAADVQRQVQEETKARAELNRQRPLNRARRARDQFMDMQRRRIENANTPKKWARRRRKLRRAVVGGTFGAGTALTMAAIKMATGASGSDVTNTAIAGGVAGYAIGNKGTQKVQEFEKMDDVRDALDKGWYTAEERKQRLSAEAIKEWKNNRDNMEVFTEAFGENARERMNSQFTEMCLTHGVQEAESIAAAHDYMQSADFQEAFSGENEETQQLLAIEAAKDIATYGDIRHDQKKLDEMRARKKNQFLENEMVQSTAAEEHRRLEEAHDQEEIRISNEESNLKTTMQNDQELIDSRSSIAEANAEVEKLNAEIASKSKEVEEAIAKANSSYDADEALYAQDLRALEEQEAEIAKEEQAIRNEEAGFAELEKYNAVGGAAEAKVTAIQSDIDHERTVYNQAVITNNTEMQARATQRISELETQKKVAEEEIAKGRSQVQQERAKLSGKRKELEDRKSSVESKKQTLISSKTERTKRHNARTEETARIEKEIAEMRKKATEQQQEVETRKKKDKELRKRKYGEQIEQLNKAKKENEKPIKTEAELREEYAEQMANQTMKNFNNILGHRDNYTG